MPILIQPISYKSQKVQNRKQNFGQSIPAVLVSNAVDTFVPQRVPFPLLKRMSSSAQMAQLKSIYQDLARLEVGSHDFATEAYTRFKRLFGLDGILGELDFDSLKKREERNKATINIFSVEIALNPFHLATARRGDIINCVVHEFKHLEQYAGIFAHNRIGFDGYVSLIAQGAAKARKDAFYVEHSPLPDNKAFDYQVEKEKKFYKSKLNSDLWRAIIDRLGLTKLDVEGKKRAQMYYLQTRKNLLFPTLKQITDIGSNLHGLPYRCEFQDTAYYMGNNAGKTLRYYTDSMEKEAEQEGHQAIVDFMRFEEQAIGARFRQPNCAYADGEKNVKDFLSVVNNLYGRGLKPGQVLPERYIAFLYDTAYEALLKGRGKEGTLKDVATELASYNANARIHLVWNFKRYLDEDKIRLHNPEELAIFDEFFRSSKSTDVSKASNASVTIF